MADKNGNNTSSSVITSTITAKSPTRPPISESDGKGGKRGSGSSFALLPLTHRVGGHVRMFRLANGAICKALTNKEREFYEDVEQKPEFRPFVPCYMGVIVISDDQQNGPKIILERDKRRLKQFTPPPTMRPIRRSTTVMLSSDSSDTDVLPIYRSGHPPYHNAMDPAAASRRPRPGRRRSCCQRAVSCPAVLRTEKVDIRRPHPATQQQQQQQSEDDQQQGIINSSLSDQDTHEFIVMEDLTFEMERPCVLDLKMGTRQHGVYAAEAKMKSQTAKCEHSTSKSLGVRMCGMQVYRGSTGKCQTQDKYVGRELDADGFRDTLHSFLSDGTRLLVEYIPDLISKIWQLQRIIKSMHGYRFFGSSLLIIYDGADTTKPVDLRLIDFAHCVTKQELLQNRARMTCPPEQPIDQPDHGYLKGLMTLMHMLQNIATRHFNSSPY
ncbi:hypothetical protein BDB00DRAFT_618613 [Zychaea mexicana]|uniref:uncharacterized protein n=1 Tax=Zychaea mexicana TaxID=64656 RepID=UPI0022FEF242|nr:uncharacterized protein BDB00DRAFT_618613 [Zychaea mexicana]KAI9489358.1 hypothetical protein BDB00DRAFT_618613 [Zychaea mexicana]